MAEWKTPKTNWGQSGQTVPIADDFNRIEGNIQHLQDTNGSHLSDYVPHVTADGGYKWGVRINPDLSLTFLFVEVE